MSNSAVRPTRQPGTPRLLRALNDRTALELLISEGPLTRTRLGELAGLSKVTASQLVERLEQRGLVTRVGEVAGGRGPSAQLYAVDPRCAYTVAVEADAKAGHVTAACVDITGTEGGRVIQPAHRTDDPLTLIPEVTGAAVRAAGADPAAVRRVVVAAPGLVNPDTGDVTFVVSQPRWHHGLLPALRETLGTQVTFENDVNLAAVAEAHAGAARQCRDFALIWLDRGVGMASMWDGRLHRGSHGSAGEIGYLPVPGAPESRCGLQQSIGVNTVRQLAREHGFDQPGVEGIRAAAEAGADGAALLDELARRISFAVMCVAIVLDPPMVVLAGALGRAGGEALARRIRDSLPRHGPAVPEVVPTGVTSAPVLAGAVHTGVLAIRDEVFGTTTD